MAKYVRTDNQTYYRNGVLYPPGTLVDFDTPPASKHWKLVEEQKQEPAPEPAPVLSAPKKGGRASDREPI